ncbi:ParA family protein [Spartinivicinus poritis]|uniref:ParA family protein n=1 Tax=Spartinivicinus poritis TaxID=2994640 RepID=A0ABT5UG24_9GAMM|nr:ParA family protein [Spartinivicinus sp. A2-2]MDE1465335.1 ParA family protein [Spartinivicinus sp. A2-2]
MAKVIAVTNQKGGVGKTTTCINVGAELARLENRVLTIDLDHQANLTKVLSGGEHEFDLTVADLFANQKAKIEDAILPAMSNGKEIEGLFFIPSHITLSRVIEQSLTRVHRERILQRHLKKVINQFDYVLLDCPPSLSLGVTNAIMVADLFLMPVDGGRFALDGLSDLLDAIEEVKETEQVNFAVFRNEFASQNKLINDFLSEQLEGINGNVLKTTVRRAEAIGQASVTAQPLALYAKSALANRDYRALTKEILDRV